MALSNVAIRTAIRIAERTHKPARLSDGRGLHLLITDTGSARWRFRYRYKGLEKMISLGIYPEVSLADARDRLDDARRLVSTGVDPSAQRRILKLSYGDTLKLIAEEFFDLHAKRLSENTLERDRWAFSKLLPYLDSRPIADITGPDLLMALRRMEDIGLHS